MLIADKLKYLREKAKQPQRRVAAALDIDTATYCKMEKGRYLPSRDQILLLSDFYKCDKDELLKVWLANRIYDVAKDEDSAHDAFMLAEDMIIDNYKKENDIS